MKYKFQFSELIRAAEDKDRSVGKNPNEKKDTNRPKGGEDKEGHGNKNRDL